MNIRTIIFGCVAAGLAATGGLLSKLQNTNTEATYIPRGVETELSKGHAGYAEYMHSIRANGVTGEIDMDAYNKAKQEVLALGKTNNKTLNMQWDHKGPDNVGGRTRAILVDKDNPNLIYAGSISGGLFVSTDGASTWTPVTNMADNLAISCITQTSTGRIFFGTGSTFENFNKHDGRAQGSPGFVGNGVYEYVPSTQTVLPVLVNSGTIPNNNGNETGLNVINAIAAKGERLYIGTGDGMLYADPTAGTYPTTTGLWTNPIYLSFPTLKQEAVIQDIDVSSNGSMIVCLANKVYYSSSDADNSFTEVPFSGMDRISAAIAPSDPNYIYLLVSKGIVQGPIISYELNGLYLSTSFDVNNAPVFENVVPSGAKTIDPFLQNEGTGSGQGDYDQAIAVDPSNRGRCLVGGVQLYEFDLVPGSNPVGGSWTKIAHLNENGSSYYMHADKHTIFWKDPNTIYFGTDGGIFKSTNGGATWTEKNLGYNTTTFFSVAKNDLGWILGGAQDNGCQMITFGEFGGPTPYSAYEVTGGDGFDVEFSSFAGGIAFTTSQYGKYFRTLLGGGNASYFYDEEFTACEDNSCGEFNTAMAYWETDNINDTLTSDSIEITFDAVDTLYPGEFYPYKSLSNSSTIYYTPDVITPVDTTDTLYWPDYIQNKMAFGLSYGSVYLTRQASNLGASFIDWIMLAGSSSTPDAFSGAALTMEFSPDGNSLFVGTDGGSLYRIDNLSAGGGIGPIDSLYMYNDSIKMDVRSPSHVVTCTRLQTFTFRAITGIAIDPNDPNNVIVTLGNYGETDYIYRSTDAMGSGTFVSIQGPTSPGTGYLPKMPVYDAEIDFVDNDRVIIGTEWGAFGSDNAFGTASAVEWYEENNGLAHVPVFAVRQETKYNLTDPDGNYLSGMYYLGTHGRGFYTSSSYVTGIDDPYEELISKTDKFVSNLNVYPNPMNNVGNISFNLKNNSKTIAKIYSLTGKLVKAIDFGYLAKGEHNENFDASNFSIGSYIVSIESGNNRSIAKFIVTR